MSRNYAALVLLLAATVPSPASACGVCVDHQTRIHLPFAAPLIPLVFLWLITMTVLKFLPFQRRLDPVDRRPTRKALRNLWVLTTLGTIGLSMLFMGGLLAPAFIMTTIWLVYLLVTTARRPWRRAPGNAAGRVWAIVGGLNAGFLLLAAFAIGKGLAVPRSTEQLIGLSGYRVSAIYTHVLPQIIAHGPEAVEPLIKAARRAVPSKGSVRRDLATSSLYCLGQICSPEAESFLQGFLRERVAQRSDLGQDWHRALAHAYAQCAGPRAVDDLTDLHRHAEGDERWLYLAALASTGSKRGVLYVIDHVPELFAVPGPGREIGQTVVTVLLEGSSAEELQRVPLLRTVHVVGGGPLLESSPDDLRAEFYWTRENVPQLHDRETLTRLWAAKSDAVRSRWESTLN
jgi:hypothetical protein